MTASLTCCALHGRLGFGAALASHLIAGIAGLLACLDELPPLSDGKAEAVPPLGAAERSHAGTAQQALSEWHSFEALQALAACQ